MAVKQQDVIKEIEDVLNETSATDLTIAQDYKDNIKSFSIVKRVIDIIGSFFGLIILSPLFLVIAILIKLEDPKGTVFFIHNRIGQDTDTFKMYKFRTMVTNAEEKLKKMLEKDKELREEYYNNFKLMNDLRITKIGNFLRKTSLDELPQLINVLKGEMSLVGPRPIVQEELDLHYKEYEKEIVFSLKPGITGMWQAYVRSDVDNYEDRKKLNLYYAKNRSLTLDFTIMKKTISTVINRKGAY